MECCLFIIIRVRLHLLDPDHADAATARYAVPESEVGVDVIGLNECNDISTLRSIYEATAFKERWRYSLGP